MKNLSLLFLLLAPKAFAFDPFTVAAVVSTAVQVVNSASEVSGSLDAFSELYSEIDTDASISEDGQKIIQQIEEIQSLANEAGYTAEDMDRAGHVDPNEMRKLEGSIRSVTKAVRAGKRAFKLFQKLEQKAQNAQVESTGIERQQLAQMYKMVRLQQEANLLDTKKELLDQINKRKQIIALRSELKVKGAKLFGRTGILSFPKSERVVETALEAASKLRAPLIGLMLLVFFARLIFYQFGFFGVARMGDLVRDAILCSLLLMIYPEIVRATLSISLELASHIGSTKVQDIKPKELNLPVLENVFTSTKLIFLYVFEWIKYGAYALIDFFMTFGIAFMVMLFPLIIFASQMMNFAVAWPIFLGSFITLCLWPLFWNLVGLAAEMSWGETQRTFVESLYSIFFTILQVLSPFIGIKIFSGQSLSKSIHESAKSVANPIMATAQSFNQARNDFNNGSRSMNGEDPKFQIAGKSGLPSVSAIAGSTQGYVKNQFHHRSQNASEAKERAPAQSYSDFHGSSDKQKATPLNAFVFNSKGTQEESTIKHFISGLKAKPIENPNKEKGR